MSRVCHNDKQQPTLKTKRKRKMAKHTCAKQTHKCTRSTKTSSLFPKRGDQRKKRTRRLSTNFTLGADVIHKQFSSRNGSLTQLMHHSDDMKIKSITMIKQKEKYSWNLHETLFLFWGSVKLDWLVYILAIKTIVRCKSKLLDLPIMNVSNDDVATDDWQVAATFILYKSYLQVRLKIYWHEKKRPLYIYVCVFQTNAAILFNYFASITLII